MVDQAAGVAAPQAQSSAMRCAAERDEVWGMLGAVMDPELPVLSIVELGIVRYVQERTIEGERRIAVGLTPTYSGCPATEMIHRAVREALDQGGYANALIEVVLSPPWTSAWLSESGREKLRTFGIAPPERPVADPRQLLSRPVACPRCGSRATQRVSEFGSTPCKAHYRCSDCLEPFDYFKCL